jgi:hypothetical protein
VTVQATTQVVVTCDNPACPNVGNYGALQPPVSTTSENGWIQIAIQRNGGASFGGIFCSKFCVRAGIQAAFS